MAKKPKEPPATLSDSFSSSGEGSSPPPSFSTVKKPSSASNVVVLPKHTVPSSESVDREEEDEDDGSESEEVSQNEESSEDSQAANANPNPSSHLREFRNANDKQASNSHPSSDSCSEFGEEAVEEVYSGSESKQQQPLPLTQAAGNTGGISGSDSASVDESPNSSDSNMILPPPRSSSRNIAGPSLKPLSSKPMGSPQLADQNILSGKRSATPLNQIAEKKRKTADIVGTGGGQEKKEISRKYWSNAEELSLLQCILNYKKDHHAIPCTEVQLEYLLKALNDSLSIPATLNQLILKIRRLKQKYIKSTKSVKGAKNPSIFNAHDASVFDKSVNIWGVSGIHDVVAFDKLKKIGVSGKVDSCLIDPKIKRKKHFAEEYPFLYWHVKSEHPDNALVHGDYVPITEAKDLEGSCKKLEIAEIQLHMQKIKLLPSALKLIEDVLAK